MEIFTKQVGYFIDKYWEMKGYVMDHGIENIVDKKLYFEYMNELKYCY
jgi:hypothetical protein